MNSTPMSDEPGACRPSTAMVDPKVEAALIPVPDVDPAACGHGRTPEVAARDAAVHVGSAPR
jgi:hypothetical protein